MTVDEWAAVCDEVKSIFGNSAKWTERTMKRVYQKFAYRTPFEAAMAEVDARFLTSATYAPTPSEIITAAMQHGGSTDITAACKNGHERYAVLTHYDDGRGKEGICIVCRTWFNWNPGTGPRTLGDIEERARRKSELQDVTR